MAVSKDLLLIGGGRMVTVLIGIVTIRVATTFLSPAQYGALTMLIAIQSLCGLFLVNPVGQHINRHTHQWWDDGSLLARLASYGKYIFGVAVFGAAAVLVLVTQPTLLQTLSAVLAMLFMVNAVTWNATFVPMLNMLGFRTSSVIWAIVTAVTALLTSFLMVSWSPTAVAWFCGQAMGLGVGALGAWWALRKYAHHTETKGDFSLLDRMTIVHYCLPLAVATGFMWLQLSGYRFVMSAYWGTDALGYAAVGLLLAGQIWALVETLAQQFLYPLFYRRINEAEVHASQMAMSDLLNFIGPLYLTFAGVTFLAAPYILKILAAPQYADAEIFVRFGVGIECCRVLGSLLSQSAQITRNTNSLTLPYTAGAFLAIGLMIVAGAQGAVITWGGVILLAASVVTLGSMATAMHRQVAFTLDQRRWLMGMAAMMVLCAPAWWLVPPASWLEAMAMLALIGLIGGGIMFGMMRKSEALQRLLEVNLREELT